MKKKYKERKNKQSVASIIIMVLLILYAVLLFFLLGWAIMVSLQKFDKNMLGGYYELPLDFIPHYGDIFMNFYMTGENNVPIYFEEIIGNTLVYALGSAFLKTLVPCLTAYACARYNFKTSKVVYTAVLTAMMVPIVGSLPSEIKVAYMFKIGDYNLIMNNLIGVCFLKANMLGLYFFVMYSAFKSMPKDYFEAARIDGASNWQMLFKIGLPLIRNVFLTVFIINFVEFWNDYQTPMIYLQTRPTLGITIWKSINNGIKIDDPTLAKAFKSQPYLMTLVITSALPVVTLFIAFKDKFMGNLTMGGIKG